MSCTEARQDACPYSLLLAPQSPENADVINLGPSWGPVSGHLHHDLFFNSANRAPLSSNHCRAGGFASQAAPALCEGPGGVEGAPSNVAC